MIWGYHYFRKHPFVLCLEVFLPSKTRSFIKFIINIRVICIPGIDTTLASTHLKHVHTYIITKTWKLRESYKGLHKRPVCFLLGDFLPPWMVNPRTFKGWNSAPRKPKEFVPYKRMDSISGLASGPSINQISGGWNCCFPSFFLKSLKNKLNLFDLLV